jgi:hypothetical protein
VSDQESHDSLDQRDEEGAEVEGHSFDAAASMDAMDSLDSLDATEEPPDVEGHSFDAPEAMEPRPDA